MTTPKDGDDNLTPDEIARRRDEVIRRMANPPPQPHVTKPRRREKKKTTAPDQKGLKNARVHKKS